MNGGTRREAVMDDPVIVAPCSECTTGDLWARPGRPTPPLCEECMAELLAQEGNK